MPETLIEVRDIRKVYAAGNGRRRKTTALDGVSLAVCPGETLGVVGPSGSGKSALGRIIASIEVPSTGTVEYRGRALAAMSGREKAAARTRMQVMFQDPQGALNPLKSIGRSLREIRVLMGMGRDEAESLIGGLLDRVGLSRDVLHRFPGELSGGQNQRVALARILMLKPELIVLDEPTSGLDVSVTAQILRLLKEIQESTGIAYVFISHDEEVVGFMCHRVVALHEGKIIGRPSGTETARGDDVL